MNSLIDMSAQSRIAWLCALALSVPGIAFGESNAGPSVKKSTKPIAVKRTNTLLASYSFDEQEAVATSFADKHHPELGKLVKRLQTAAPAKYRDAIADLFADAHRINRSKRDQDRFEVELRVWKAESRARLMAAQMASTRDAKSRDAAEAKLRKTLKELTAAKLAKLILERKRSLKRLELIEKRIADIEADSAAVVEREFSALQRSLATKSRDTRKKPSKNAVKTVSTKGENNAN